MSMHIAQTSKYAKHILSRSYQLLSN